MNVRVSDNRGSGKTIPVIPSATFKEYRNGASGLIKWAEENVYVPIFPIGASFQKWWPLGDLPDTKHPDTGRSYQELWKYACDVFNDAIVMKDGRFKYRLVCFCEPRGEGKSFKAVLIQMWKFFNWAKQQIMLCANSKDQSKFVHFDEISNIILNSPNLLKIVGKKNIQEKEIKLRDARGNVASRIRSISSFSGIVSNITGYTFSEIFDMKKPDFFSQVDGSIRNVPNAFGVIDSTVAPKNHIFYKLYESYVQQTDKTLFFYYRSSKQGLCEDYQHPYNTQEQLDSYRIKFLPNDFAKYFLNLWSAAGDRLFSRAYVAAINYFGVDGIIGNQKQIIEALIRRTEIVDSYEEMKAKMIEIDRSHELKEVDDRLIPVSKYYNLVSAGVDVQMASLQDLNVMSDFYDTDWAILSGIDRADAAKTREGGARTMFVAVAKGLPGSRSNPNAWKIAVPAYVYILLCVANIGDHSLDNIKQVMMACHEEYDGVDKLYSERWGAWDLAAWAEDKIGCSVELGTAPYDRQLAGFTAFFTLVTEGRFKSPKVHISGSKEDDILQEEMMMIDHDADKRWFGSPEKKKKYGVQDDTMFALVWAIYGGRMLTVDEFRIRESNPYFGTMVYP